MAQFVYIAWFRDPRFPSDDQDYEWVACFIIEAEDARSAQAWGDHLARDRAARKPEEPFLWSEVRSPDDPMFTNTTAPSPIVSCGVEATDKFLGW